MPPDLSVIAPIPSLLLVSKISHSRQILLVWAVDDFSVTVKVKIPPCQSNSLNLLLVENIAVLNTRKPHEKHLNLRLEQDAHFLPPFWALDCHRWLGWRCRLDVTEVIFVNLRFRIYWIESGDFVALPLKQLPKSEKQASECVL